MNFLAREIDSDTTPTQTPRIQLSNSTGGEDGKT
jgi:hypothetical protein